VKRDVGVCIKSHDSTRNLYT